MQQKVCNAANKKLIILFTMNILMMKNRLYNFFIKTEIKKEIISEIFYKANKTDEIFMRKSIKKLMNKL